MMHGGMVHRCVDGKMRASYTLCGLVVGSEQKGVTTDEAKVECKRCRRSAAWFAFMMQPVR